MNMDAQKHVEYGRGYLELKMYEDAIHAAEAALALAPKCSQALAIKSTALWELNRLAEAEPVIAQLADVNPNNAGVWINLAYIRRRTQSVDAAVETLQRAFEANPRDAMAHFNMACYRAVQARPDEAIAMLRSALRLDPKLIKLAKIERDFDSLRGLPLFQAVINDKTA